MITRTPIDSSNLVSAGYDPDSAVLEVEFKGGGVYRYLEVPPNKATAFFEAPSQGSFLSHEIRGTHPFERVDVKPEPEA